MTETQETRRPRREAKAAKPGSVRISEVARLAGVSNATVSRALRDPELVSPELRARVETAARRLKFKPSPIAGTLAGANAPLIGVVVPTMTNAFFAGTLEAMAGPLALAGYQVMVAHHEYDFAREEAAVAAFLQWKPAALVVTGVHHSRTVMGLLANAPCPVVEMWDLDARAVDSIVGFSNYDVGRAAARHLWASGRRRLLYVGAMLDRDPRADARRKGFADAVQDLSGASARIHHAADRTVAAGCLLFEELEDIVPGFDGIAFSSDALALGALFEAQRCGVRIPGDLSLIGYGDLDFAPYSNPALTTLRPPRHAIGAAVAGHLLERIAAPGSEGRCIDLGFELVVRGSG